MKPASRAGVWLCSARMPLSRTSSRPGGMTLKKSFGSPFMQRRLYAKQRQGGCVTHAGFQTRLSRKVSSQSVQSHPRSRQIGSYLIGSGLAFARVQPTGFGRHKPYSSSKRGFCVRAMDADKSQSVRENGRADVRSLGQSMSGPGPCPGRDRVQSENSPCPRLDCVRNQFLTIPRPHHSRECPHPARVRKLSVSSPHPRRVHLRLRVNRPSILWLPA